MGFGELWNAGPIALMINTLTALSSVVGGSFGWAVIIMTIIIRVAMYPLTAKQLHASRAMQELQPKIAELQKKYARDKQRLADEQMLLYKEHGISPSGCAVPMLIQMPIWVALYQSIMKVLPMTPEDLLGLSRFMWNWPAVYTTLPLDSTFFWLNLVESTPGIAVIVGVTMWLQQKMVTPNTTDPAQRSQSELMLWMMPLMFGFLAMSFPAGLALYWVVSNVISIFMQYFVIGGWGGLSRSGAAATTSSVTKLSKRVAREESLSAQVAAPEADIVDTNIVDKGKPKGYSPPTRDRVKHQKKGKKKK